MSKWISRPHCGGLAESLAESKTFDTISELINYQVEKHDHAFNYEDVEIKYYGYDYRIKTDIFVVCTKRYYNEDYIKKYGCSQCIAFCSAK